MNTTYAIRVEGTSSQVVDGELLVINLDTSFYYGLNRTATAVWSSLGSPLSASALTEVLAGSFEADPETIGGDVERLLADLVEEGLVIETEAVAHVPSSTTEVPGGEWESPTLERYERLDQLILSGE